MDLSTIKPGASLPRTFTVGELIMELQKFDSDLKVGVSSHFWPPNDIETKYEIVKECKDMVEIVLSRIPGAKK